MERISIRIITLCLLQFSITSLYPRDIILTQHEDNQNIFNDYREQSRLCDSTSIEIYKNRVEDLRERYKLEDLEIVNLAHRNELMSHLLWAAALLILMGGIASLIIILGNRKLRASRLRLEQAEHEAAEATHNKSVLLSNMSHEIRTPLGAIAGFSELLGNGMLEQDCYEECREIMELNSHLLMKLIDDVIDSTSISKMEFNLLRVDAVTLMRQTLDSISKAKGDGAILKMDSTSESLMIMTDPGRLQQVLTNLVVNAIKFTPNGGTITLSLEEMKGSDMVRFSVSDTGCGIPADKQHRLFGRFEKLHEGVPGTGLGLSICRVIVTRMGGEIHLDPGYTQGARFVFTHPITTDL